jgi:DegV family protein with EDD domain
MSNMNLRNRDRTERRDVSIRVVTDSNCDLPKDLVDQYGIVVVPLYINIGTESFLDGVELSREQFYHGLPDFESHPTTSVPSPGQFLAAYERLANEGATQILSIQISKTLSAVTNSARLAAEETDRVAVTVFDSGQLTLGTGLQVVAAAQAAADGRSADEIVVMLKELGPRIHVFAVLDTLEFMRRSGRLSRFQFGLGSLLQLKVIIMMHDGEVSVERVRTRKRAVARMITLVRELTPLEELALVHTHAPAQAADLLEQASDLFPGDQGPLSAEVTPVIGAHIGPGAVGFVAIRAGDPEVAQEKGRA